jgi:DNA-binding Lrp family transcriptional regulator
MTMVEAYVLIQAEVGMAEQVWEDVGKIGGVRSANVVAGPYDVIARVESTNVDELGKLVVTTIQAVKGITRTLTCPVVRL